MEAVAHAHPVMSEQRDNIKFHHIMMKLCSFITTKKRNLKVCIGKKCLLIKKKRESRDRRSIFLVKSGGLKLFCFYCPTVYIRTSKQL